jgi:hypothetical protein
MGPEVDTGWGDALGRANGSDCRDGLGVATPGRLRERTITLLILVTILSVTAGTDVGLSVRAAARPTRAVAASVGTTFARPALATPITLALHVGADRLRLRDGRDYVLVLPRVKKTGVLEIRGGRNIWVIGGYLSVAKAGPNIVIADGPNARAGRVVHLEGLMIDGSSGAQSDGIRINAPRAIVQVVRCRIVGLRGRAAGLHADVIQPFGGMKALRIDGLTASSHYNNLFLRRENDPLGPRIGAVTIRNANIFGYWNGSQASPRETLRAISFGTQTVDPSDSTSRINCRMSARLVLREFFIKPARQRPGQFVYPHDRMQRAGCAARLSADGRRISWPALDRVDGVARVGEPPGGSFVPATSVGLHYPRPNTSVGSISASGIGSTT